MVLKKMRFTVLSFLVGSVFLAGCPAGLEIDTSPGLAKVYTAGYSAGGVPRACYWVDDQPQTIAEADQGIATKAACVVPTDYGDYVAGARTDIVEMVLIERAILWFNGKGEFLDDKHSFAFSAALHDGKIFVAGWRDPDGSGNRPCVWEVSDTWTIEGGGYVVSSREIIRHDLPTDGGFGAARDIVSDGSDLYVCGYYTQGINSYACYWKNGSRVGLVDGTRAEAICIHEGRVYVGGRSATSASYWIDGNGYEISNSYFPVGSTDAIVTAVALVEGELHLGGSYYKGDYLGFTWNAGTLTVSLPPVIGAGAHGADLYLGCEECWLKNGDDTPLQWIGGLRPRGIRMRLY